MLQVVISGGEIRVVDVPAPALRSGALLVRTFHSLISAGTESAGLQSSRQSLVERAVRNPAMLRNAARQLVRGGLGALTRQVRARARNESALGYSCSGIVVEVAPGVTLFRAGDRVACGGGGHANHAAFNVVPQNLVVPLPEAVSFEEGAFATLGAIALQGVRRCAPTLGERVLVVGLGLIGQLTAQLLRAAGAVVIGVDLDRHRVEKARRLGMPHGFALEEIGLAEGTKARSDGRGADAVIVTAASRDATLLDAACTAVRRKGRVVLVGDVPIRFARESLYAKELDFFISTSYGPGRYDRDYEEKGHDYPFGYVRWTERRNLSEVLRLIAAQAIDVRSLIGGSHRAEEAQAAYASLSGRERPIAVLLDFRAPSDVAPALSRSYTPRKSAAAALGRLGVGVVGYGSYFRSTLEPLLRAHPGFRLRAVSTRSGLNVRHAVDNEGWERGSTDYQEILADPEVRVVFVTTRHDLHFPVTRAALLAGKDVFVEKPLALSSQETRQLVDLAREKGVLLTVGFNRRFSPHAVGLKAALEATGGARTMVYRVDAGAVPEQSWVLDPLEGGGRVRGEAVHFFDFLCFLAGAPPLHVRAAAPVSDRVNETITCLEFADGSLGTVIYTGRGAQEPSKERVEVFAGGRTLVLDDFRALASHGPGASSHGSRRQEKGQREQLQNWYRALRNEEAPGVTGEDGHWATWCAELAVASGGPALDEQLRPISPDSNSD